MSLPRQDLEALTGKLLDLIEILILLQELLPAAIKINLILDLMVQNLLPQALQEPQTQKLIQPLLLIELLSPLLSKKSVG